MPKLIRILVRFKLFYRNTLADASEQLI